MLPPPHIGDDPLRLLHNHIAIDIGTNYAVEKII